MRPAPPLPLRPRLLCTHLPRLKLLVTTTCIGYRFSSLTPPPEEPPPFQAVPLSWVHASQHHPFRSCRGCRLLQGRAPPVSSSPQPLSFYSRVSSKKDAREPPPPSSPPSSEARQRGGPCTPPERRPQGPLAPLQCLASVHAALVLLTKAQLWTGPSLGSPMALPRLPTPPAPHGVISGAHPAGLPGHCGGGPSPGPPPPPLAPAQAAASPDRALLLSSSPHNKLRCPTGSSEHYTRSPLSLIH